MEKQYTQEEVIKMCAKAKQEGVEEMWCLYHQETGNVFAGEMEKRKREIKHAYDSGFLDGKHESEMSNIIQNSKLQ